MKKWLRAADIRREIVTGLQAWFEKTDNKLEAAAAAEDADEAAIRMGKDEDDPDDSDNDRLANAWNHDSVISMQGYRNWTEYTVIGIVPTV
jgi:hypothetical protein